MKTHDESKCSGEFCCVHNPSDHPLRGAPLHFRLRGGILLAERICEHGIGHPDPDHLSHMDRTYDWFDRQSEAVHGCDGDC